MLDLRATRAATLVGALLAAGCMRGDADRDAAADSAADTAAASASAAADPARVVTVIASDYTFDAPAEVPAGLTTFRLVNRGPSVHHVQLFRLDSGKTAAEFEAAIKQAGPPPRWMIPAGGPNPPELGDTASATMALEPGNYIMVCFVPSADGKPHLMKGMTKPLTVTGTAPSGAVEPTADVVVTLKDYDFVFSKPLTAGKHTIRIDNAGPQPHEIVFVRPKAGKTGEDFAKWAEHPKGEAPGTLHGGVSAIMPNSRAFVDVDLPAGDYTLICFISDEKDGKPHLAHGMIKKITVS